MESDILIQPKAGEMMGHPYFRLIPDYNINTVGSFFLLDHIYERNIEPKSTPKSLDGSTAHPHRGIATVTYLLQGENEHQDSIGNKQIVTAGGLQWMNSGKGIIHDEGMTLNMQKSGGKIHLMQFWILLPELNRAQKPTYQSLHNDMIAENIIDTEGSKLRVLIGSYENVRSQIPNFNNEFLYHISIQEKGEFFYTPPANYEIGIFAAKGKLTINKNELEESNLLVNKMEDQTYHLKNETSGSIDIMLFGSSPYTDKYFARGPFVMGDSDEIQMAYNDFYYNKYGEINY